ncbi:MAG TPA: cytochrome c oxidase subunit II [Vicinamibacterales bacterium]|nr:cytochrome c oxidase subunit II [Vicinamibacterales bacterium]
MRRLFGLWAALGAASGCSGVQSALAPSGFHADYMARLFWWMTGGALLVWLFVVALAVFYARRARGETNRRRDRWLIVGGGVAFPTIVLTVLLVYGLALIPPTVARAPEGSLQIAVTGEQWWWRVRYLRPTGEEVVLANEIRLPVGEPVQFRLDSDNVIHSFWIPSLGGKMDMIPGRVTWLTLRPTKTGVFRGACAEYCGTSHALMAFYVEVMERADFDRWLDSQAAPAREPADAGARRGAALFLSNGCSACHTIRGTAARGVIGPDLTHVGGRLSLGAGILQTTPDELRRWIASTEHVKPGVHMPNFGMLPLEELQAMAEYLHALK